MNELDLLEEEFEEEEAEEQSENKGGRADHLKPWQFKKGQSGNPGGRPPGPSLKEYAKKLLASMNEEERLEYLHGLDKKTIWEMAEGKPEAKVDAKVDHRVTEITSMSDDELIRITTGGEEGAS